MCGRYSAAKDFSELVKRAGGRLRAGFFAPRYNIAPTQSAAVIFMDGGQPAVKLMRWGLIPARARPHSEGGVLINARVETLANQPAFREAYRHRRCLIPADGFYEWQERAGQRQPFRVMLQSGEPFCFAGVWDRWVRLPSPGNPHPAPAAAPPGAALDSFTIITQPASAALAPLHDRMPVILAPEYYSGWLTNADPPNAAHRPALAHPLAEPLKIYPVSTLVNSPKAEDPRCLEPARIDRDFFDRQWWSDR